MLGNILILSAGRRVSLVNAFCQAAESTDLKIKVIAGDANPELSSACQVSHSNIRLPRISDPDFIPFLKQYAADSRIKIIIPTIDTELLILSQHKKQFEAAGIYILTGNPDFISVCRNKRLTHKFFQDNGIAVAAEYSRDKVIFPLFAKPVDGSSSNHLYYAPDESHLPPFVLKDDRFMLLEYLDRKEYDEFTCDTYYNISHELCCVVPRKRLETRGGEISKGYTSKNFLINLLRNKFAKLDGVRGCVTMQFFVHRTSMEVRGIEINPRFGGGYPLSFLAGANFPQWIIEEYLENNSVSWFDAWEDNLLMLRHDNELLLHDYKHQ